MSLFIMHSLFGAALLERALCFLFLNVAQFKERRPNSTIVVYKWCTSGVLRINFLQILVIYIGQHGEFNLILVGHELVYLHNI